MSKEENVADYKFALEKFFDSVKSISPPRILIIERNSSIRKAFESLDIEGKFGTKLQYCYYHLAKSLKTQIRNMIHQSNFSEDVRDILLRIEKLPLVESFSKFEIELSECKKVVNTNKNITGNHQSVMLLMNKIYDER